jgi:hypothetical protein
VPIRSCLRCRANWAKTAYLKHRSTWQGRNEIEKSFQRKPAGPGSEIETNPFRRSGSIAKSPEWVLNLAK